MELDPASADVPAELAELYGRQSQMSEAVEWAGVALTKEPDHSDANRILGTIYAELASRDERAAPAAGGTSYRKLAIDHLERALKDARRDVAAGVRLMLAQQFMQSQAPDKAIPVLRQLLADEPWLPQGVALLSDAYTGAGRQADAIALLKDAATMEPSFYGTLAETYEKAGNNTEAAEAYAKASEQDPGNFDLKTHWASVLLSSADTSSTTRARDLLLEVTKANPTAAWPLYLLARAQRALGELDASETSARTLLAVSPGSTSGAHALAQVLEARREWGKLITALEPIVAKPSRGRDADTALVLTHLGFAYLEVGRADDGVAAFDRAVKLDPQDADLKHYLAQALVTAKKYDRALGVIREQRATDPSDPKLARIEADALRGMGKPDDGVALLKKFADAATGEPTAAQVLGEYYASLHRYADAALVLKRATATYPDDLTVLFQYGATLERQKQFAEAERVFRQVLAKDPAHGPSLNYLGYTLVERGVRLDEALAFIKRAVGEDPYNGAYLDSLGWAYVKLSQFDQAERPLRMAAEQLPKDSVVQEHWGDLLARKGRYAEAIEAWRRSLAGDGEQIERAQIERKIREALDKAGRE
ncbi:MAG: tetratricopeptide repeat protein [Acidobacteria bacterium]|nr:tetratricopeptide repeat protein [Acidobacteriota bacterium]